MEQVLEREYLRILYKRRKKELTPEQIKEILDKKVKKRSEHEKIVLFGISLRYEVLKKFSKIIQKKHFNSFVNRFSMQSFEPGEIMYQIGDYKESQKVYFILKGKV